jgi:hypothetical protein
MKNTADRITRLLGVTGLGLLLAGATAVAAESLFVDYEWQGGHSPYKTVNVGIADDGATRVTIAKHSGPAVDYQTALSREELGALGALVASTEFFTRPATELDISPDTGQTTLTISLPPQRPRTLSYRSCRDLDPLTAVLWKLVAQAEAVSALKADEDIYRATNVVKPTMAGAKALQPERLKEALGTYLRTHRDRQRVAWALEALAFVTTEEEFSGFVALALKEPQQREVFLTIVGSHPFVGNIPASHWQALCPTYLAFTREARARQEPLTDAEKQALSEFTQMLGETRYQPAIRVLKTWFEAHQKPYVDGSFTPLAKMGLAGLEALVPYLQSPAENHRLNAIELLVIAARNGPRSGFANPLPAQEYGRMMSVFTNTVIPQLTKLSEQDAAPKVKAAAGKAITEIQQRLEENTP